MIIDPICLSPSLLPGSLQIDRQTRVITTTQSYLQDRIKNSAFCAILISSTKFDSQLLVESITICNCNERQKVCFAAGSFLHAAASSEMQW